MKKISEGRYFSKLIFFWKSHFENCLKNHWRLDFSIKIYQGDTFKQHCSIYGLFVSHGLCVQDVTIFSEKPTEVWSAAEKATDLANTLPSPDRQGTWLPLCCTARPFRNCNRAITEWRNHWGGLGSSKNCWALTFKNDFSTMRVKANQERALFKKGKGTMSWISWGTVETVLGKCFRASSWEGGHRWQPLPLTGESPWRSHGTSQGQALFGRLTCGPETC